MLQVCLFLARPPLLCSVLLFSNYRAATHALPSDGGLDVYTCVYHILAFSVAGSIQEQILLLEMK